MTKTIDFPKNGKEALNRMMEGNDRFINGIRAVEPMFSHLKMNELSENGQKPFVIVLTCSDSRSPVEMIFDQGIGDVFVVRVAGNVVAPSLLASMEFAAANFGSPLLLVMGHTKCGAVKATLQHSKNPDEELPSVHLEELVSRIRPAVEKTAKKFGYLNDPHMLELCTVENVKRSMSVILDQSTIIRNFVNEGKLQVEGAVLDIQTGRVNLLSVHENNLAKNTTSADSAKS
jgi:carbonic anhydrase